MNMGLLMLTAMAALSFTACNSDTDNDDGDDANLKLTLAYKYEVSQDVLDLYDVKITYLLPDGTTKSETMSSTEWNKSSELTTYPVNCGFKVTFTRNGKAMSKEKYDITLIPLILAYQLNDDDSYNVAIKPSLPQVSTMGIKASAVEGVYNNYTISYTYKISHDNGSFSINPVSIDL